MYQNKVQARTDVVITQCEESFYNVYVYQIIMLYTFNISQIYLLIIHQ